MTDTMNGKLPMALEQLVREPEFLALTDNQKRYVAERIRNRGDAQQAVRWMCTRKAVKKLGSAYLVACCSANWSQVHASAPCGQKYLGLSEREKFLQNLEHSVRKANGVEPAQMHALQAKILCVLPIDATLPDPAEGESEQQALHCAGHRRGTERASFQNRCRGDCVMAFDPNLPSKVLTSPVSASQAQKPRANPGEPVSPACENGAAISAPAPVEPPHTYIPIQYDRQHFPFTILCGCGREVPADWRSVDSPWKLIARLLGHGHCPHELGYGHCPFEAQEEANASRLNRD